MRRIVFALGFALALATPAAAQRDTLPARSFTPSHLAAARELLQEIQIQKLSMAGVEAMFTEQIRANPEMGRYREAMLAWARDIFSSEEATNAFAALYAEAFSEEDVRALTAFYRTPLGQRVAAMQPVIATRGADLGRRLAERKQADLIARIQQVDSKRTTP
ncbi:MAG TPA: DUF2059 domain-containing protein [Longimicrobium sp.]|nr:DUF2059 domain-containing protein [Longimicrobium sp.]